MAIEDAFLLSILLAKGQKLHQKDGHQEAFYQYFYERFPHTTKVAKESYQQSQIGQWKHPFALQVRELILRKVPAFVLEKKLQKVNLWNVNPWLKEFQILSKST